MERNILLFCYKSALYLGTFMLANFAIGTEQLKLYIYFFNKETFQILHKAKRIFSLKDNFR
jgi:hypothetical protein